MNLAIRKSLLLFVLTVLFTGSEGLAQQVFIEREIQGVARTRAEFWALLKQYPPKLGQVLRTEHSLLSNETYLAPYPELREYLKTHPEILRDPEYFVGKASDETDELRERLQMELRRNSSPLRDVFEGFIVFSVFVASIAGVMWIVRSIGDHRRWLRVWRAQADAHSKMMDRMTTNEELLAYLQTPAGRRFFESASMPMDFGPTRQSVPAGRIMWSVQLGLVLLVGGFALQLAKIDPQLSAPDVSAMNVMSIVAIGLGISFILGAGTSYMISAKLGLLEQPVRRPPSNIDTPTST
jgi:hypothetical protein